MKLSKVRALSIGAMCTAVACLALVATAPSAQAATDSAAVSVQLDHATAAYGTAIAADVTVLDASQQPVSNAAVVVHATPGTTTPTAVSFALSASTGSDGHALVPLTLHAATWTITVTYGSVTSAPATVVITPALVTLQLTANPGSVISRGLTTLTATMQSPTAPQATLAATNVLVYALVQPDKAWHTVSATHALLVGNTVTVVSTQHVWRPTSYRFDLVATDDLASATANTPVYARAEQPAIIARHSAPVVRYPIGGAPVGSSANPVVTTIPDSVWATMVGATWRPGCTSRSQLRLVSVNYWGFDGYSYRGQIIVRKTISTRVSQAFTLLYYQHFRIRSMFLPDRYGRNPIGPGANDYASMTADNTSGFNCRYVDGSEYAHRWSAHSVGVAIDVNPWENPYIVGRSQLPDRYFAGHRGAAAGVFTSGAAATVRDFTGRHANWGGTWSERDFQHFQW